MCRPSQDFTPLLEAALDGDEAAQKRMFSILYDELHRLAQAAMRGEKSGHVLQTTALVHEAYVRLVNDEARRWENRTQFFKIAAGAMRRILVDEARRSRAAKRGGDRRPLVLDTGIAVRDSAGDGADDLLDLEALEQALKKLAAEGRHERKCAIVEMRFFAGLPLEEVAKVLGIWLRREIDLAAGSCDVT